MSVTERWRLSEGNFIPSLSPEITHLFGNQPEGHTCVCVLEFLQVQECTHLWLAAAEPLELSTQQEGTVFNTVPFLPRYKGVSFFWNGWRGIELSFEALSMKGQALMGTCFPVFILPRITTGQMVICPTCT